MNLLKFLQSIATGQHSESHVKEVEASVILAKCSEQNRAFAIRVEKRNNDWVSTWAFPIDEAKAKREGFDRTKITGSLRAVDRYPGCPYCGNYYLTQCGRCGKVSCDKENSKIFHCNWCGNSGEIDYVDSFTVHSGDF